MYNLYYLKSNLDQRIYIGISKNPKQRYNNHLNYTIKKSHFNGNWIRKTLERGGNIEMIIIKSGLSMNLAINLEIEFIKMFRNMKVIITNTADGGLGFNHKGIPHSEEHKRALEKAQPHKVRIPKDEIYNLYINKKLSKKSIADIYKCGTTTIDRRLKEYKIKIRTTKNYKVSKKLNIDNIIDMYLNKKMSILSISKFYKIGNYAIREMLMNKGIDTNLNKSLKNKVYNRKYTDETIQELIMLCNNNKSLSEISNLLGIDKTKVSYLKNRYYKQSK